MPAVERDLKSHLARSRIRGNRQRIASFTVVPAVGDVMRALDTDRRIEPFDHVRDLQDFRVRRRRRRVGAAATAAATTAAAAAATTAATATAMTAATAATMGGG